MPNLANAVVALMPPSMACRTVFSPRALVRAASHLAPSNARGHHHDAVEIPEK